MSETITLEQDARAAWRLFADPYRSAFVRTHVIVYDSDAKNPSQADTYDPEPHEYIPDVLARIEPNGHDRMVLIARLVGNMDKPDGTLTSRPPQEFKVVIAVDKEGNSFALSQSDGMPEPWEGVTAGPIFAEMVTTLHDSADLDAELANLLGDVGTDPEA